MGHALSAGREVLNRPREYFLGHLATFRDIFLMGPVKGWSLG